MVVVFGHRRHCAWEKTRIIVVHVTTPSRELSIGSGRVANRHECHCGWLLKYVDIQEHDVAIQSAFIVNHIDFLRYDTSSTIQNDLLQRACSNDKAVSSNIIKFILTRYEYQPHSRTEIYAYRWMCTCIMCVVQSYGQRAAQIYGIDDSIQTVTSDQIWQAHGSHQRTRLRIYEDNGAQFTRAGIGPPEITAWSPKTWNW